MDHLRELRSRVIKALLAIVLGTAVGLIPWVFDRVWRFMEHPFCAATINGHTGCHQVLGDQLVVTGIFDPFTLRVEVAFFFGLIVTSPVWLYQLWAFIAPGLYAAEKRWTYGFVFAAVPLFLIGAALAYLVMDRGLRFLLGLAPHGTLVLPSISTYLGYFLAMILGFGLTFELPLALVLLNYARILTHERFRKWRRVMIFAVFVFAGIACAEPGSAHHAAARRALRGPGRGRRGHRVGARPAAGPAARSRTRDLETTKPAPLDFDDMDELPSADH